MSNLSTFKSIFLGTTVFIAAVSANAGGLQNITEKAEHHIKVPLEATAAGAGVTGFVQLTRLPQEDTPTSIHVNAAGLTPGTEYAAFYYESDDCTFPADLLEEFVANPGGHGHASGKIDEEIDEVGSVSIRLGPGYETLIACATVHPD